MHAMVHATRALERHIGGTLSSSGEPTRVEALRVLQTVADELASSTSVELTSVLRRLARVCLLMSWADAHMWFNRQLMGYPPGTELPPFRRITGKSIWEKVGSAYDKHKFEVEKAVYGSELDDTELCTLEVRAPLEFLLGGAAGG